MDWQLTCRVCLENGTMVSLFDWDENNEQLSDKFSFCSGIQVHKDDNLPTLICLDCVDKLTYSFKFKEQCLSSNETLKECLEEFLRNAAQDTGSNSIEESQTEMMTIKQENGLLMQYELPVEHDPQGYWTKTHIDNKHISTVVTKAPEPKKRGRPRKYPNEQGQIDLSPYQRKKPKELVHEPEALTTMLANGSFEIKHEIDIDDAENILSYDDDPDFVPGDESETDNVVQIEKPKKRGRPRKRDSINLKQTIQDQMNDDMLLNETIFAITEPIPDHILNPKPKKRYPSQKKKYVYNKTHTCETCGSSFTSNATLQAHIRRHLGIKPFVCSICGYACVLNMELRRHMMRHTGVRPYKCRVCDRRFGDYGSRQKHERLHMGVRPYQCTQCGKSFTYSYVLSNHMLTHTGEKKFSCAPCGRRFTKAHHLKYHNKVHHKELYLQQEMEADAKKARQQINISSLSGVLSGQMIDGTLHLIQNTSEDGEQDYQMQVIEELKEDEDEIQEEEQDEVTRVEDVKKETERAVAEMQAEQSLFI